jgi:hypothetical protein
MSYKSTIAQAEVMAMEPETVVVLIKRRASQTKEQMSNDPINEEVEAALLSRNHPAINLALARYGRFRSTLMTLFHGSEPSAPIRLAALSNTVVDGRLCSIPIELFKDQECLAAWLQEATDLELCALFENPKIDDTFLRDLLEEKEPWEALPDERRAQIVINLHTNKRTMTPYEETIMDGYLDYRYSSVFNAAWGLAARVPVTKIWARALCLLYQRLEPEAFSISKPLELTSRWHIDPSDAAALEAEARYLESGNLSDYQSVRRDLARLALSGDSALLQTLLDSDDPALRSAAYSAGALSPEQISMAYDRDGELVFNQTLHNHAIWRRLAGRQALHTLAWAVVKNDPWSELSAANIFNMVRDQFTKTHPEWFKDEDDFQHPIELSDKPATKADLQLLSDILTKPAYGLALAEDKDDTSSDLSTANVINTVRDELPKTHPEWFKDEDDFQQPIEPGDRPATKADLQLLADILTKPTGGLDMAQLKQTLKAIQSRLGWVWAFALGALVASLWRH